MIKPFSDFLLEKMSIEDKMYFDNPNTKTISNEEDFRNDFLYDFVSKINTNFKNYELHYYALNDTLEIEKQSLFTDITLTNNLFAIDNEKFRISFSAIEKIELNHSQKAITFFLKNGKTIIRVSFN